MKPSIRRRRGLAGALLACLVALTATACGADDDDGGSRSSGSSNGARAVEKAFLTTMVPHHESAIEMARVAKTRGEDPFVTNLAADILASQRREVKQMEAIHERLLGTELIPDPGGHDRLGLSAAEAGMTHDAKTIDALRMADPFDRAFVDDMAPHHAGAIKMARVVLRATKDSELRRLARDIVSTQRREIARMNRFRTQRFGGPAPGAGGHGDRQMREGNEPHDGGHPG